MSVFIDTSALLAVLDAGDVNHRQARQAWVDLIERREALVCTNYILVETIAVAQRRLGLPAVRALHEDIAPILQIEWVSESSHCNGMSAMLIAGRRRLSLVDCVSFDTMRQLGMKAAFTFDRHFVAQGFAAIP